MEAVLFIYIGEKMKLNCNIGKLVIYPRVPNIFPIRESKLNVFR